MICPECGIEFDSIPWVNGDEGEEVCDLCLGYDLDEWSPDEGEFPEEL